MNIKTAMNNHLHIIYSPSLNINILRHATQYITIIISIFVTNRNIFKNNHIIILNNNNILVN